MKVVLVLIGFGLGFLMGYWYGWGHPTTPKTVQVFCKDLNYMGQYPIERCK